MSLSQTVLDTISRLKQYNLGIYNAVSNKFGLSGKGGMAVNWSRHSKDIATACEMVSILTEASATSESNAAASAEAAANSAQSAQQDAEATAADRQATGQDRQATDADRQAVAQDKAAVHQDRLAADEDAQATAADRQAVADDRNAVHQDRLAADAAAAAAAEDAQATAADRQAVHDDRVAAEQAAANAQTWDPTNYIQKRGMQSYTFQTLDLNTLSVVGETRYLDATNSPNAPAGGAGYGYYIGFAGGDAGGNLGLQVLVTQNGKFFWRDKFAGGWREVLHSGRIGLAADGSITLDAGAKITTASGNTQIQAPDGSKVQLGGGQTGASPESVHVVETVHATSRRATLFIGNAWAWMQDTAASGVRDIGLYSSAISSFVLKVAATTGVLTFLRAVLSQPVNLGSVSGTVTLDLSLGNTFNATLVGVTTFAAPTNLGNYVGMYFTLNLAQDGTGGRTAGWNTVFNFGGSALTLSTGANKIDRVTCYVYSGTQIHVVSKKGY